MRLVWDKIKLYVISNIAYIYIGTYLTKILQLIFSKKYLDKIKN